MALEDLLREAAKRGLTHLSLAPVPSTDAKTTYWLASATPSTMHKYISTTSKDPVEALEQVLKALPKAPKRAPRKGDDLLTATVTEPLDMDESAERLAKIDTDYAQHRAERDQQDPAADWMLKS